MIYIKNYAITKEGISITLNEPSTMKGRSFKSKTWFLSWDKIGGALFENYDSSGRPEIEDKENEQSN